MTPAEFFDKWHNNPLGERQGAQSHFLDLCDLLGVEKPFDQDNYCFERGATRTGAGRGWSDVWKRSCFGFEYKAPGADLSFALKQLMTYALALDNPPLLVVSDRERIEIHTHFTGTPSETYTYNIADLSKPEVQQQLRWMFDEPERFKPAKTIRQATEEAAGKFADLAVALTDRGIDPQRAAHFLNKCLFAMFAEDVSLLGDKLFTRMLEASEARPVEFVPMIRDLFAAMQKGGRIGFEPINWFNGGLFNDDDAIDLTKAEIKMLLGVAKMDWSQIEPSIFGTLFERGLDPKKRSQLGAHYTDPVSIMRLVNPVIVEPLREEWEAIKAQIAALAPEFGYIGRKLDRPNEARRRGNELLRTFLDRLRDYRVLDPACGSGNFLYLALKALKDMEHRANLEAEALGLQRQVSIETCPANVMGIEINEYAAELARVTVWIGEIQWMLAHGYQIRRNPILAKLDHIEHRDALINEDGSEAAWPAADAIIGNPPFLGDKRMRRELGDGYVDILRSCFDGRVPGGADLVTYWYEKARAQIVARQSVTAGLVATNSIRDGANRLVLDRISSAATIFDAWSDEPWINDGASVRVSLISFGSGISRFRLDGREVSGINSDLTVGGHAGINLTLAAKLHENEFAALIGSKKFGAFDIPGDLARKWLTLPNPNARPNSDVLFLWANGIDIIRRPSDTWVVDFGLQMTEEDAALYELPFAYALESIKPIRTANRREWRADYWWRHGEPQPKLREKLKVLQRFIVTPEVAKHRVFRFLPKGVSPDGRLIVICKSDDEMFGLLSSRLHSVWSLAIGSRLEDRPCYNPSRCFSMYPFPAGLTPDLTKAEYANPQSIAIADAAKRLNDFRESWLNPPEWVDRIPEVVAGYPDRMVPKPQFAAELKKRTLTNLYNARPAWLDNAHKELDRAVAAAYGWTDYTPDMPDEEILRRLLALNLDRAASASIIAR